MPQNYNNIMTYIKVNLGSKLQNLEIEDQEFVTYFNEHTLREFSLIEPSKAWSLLTPSNAIKDMNRGGIVYEFKINENTDVLDVHEIYYGSMISTLTGFGSFFFDPTDVVMSNTLNSMLEFLRTVNVFQFFKPNKVLLSEKLSDMESAIVELNISHESPYTIPSDLYHDLFLKMCLRDSIQMVLSNRIKYTSLSSPYGEINLNIDYLQNRLENLNSEISEKNDWLPHREYLHIV